MAGININRLSNANVYSNGNSLLGKVEEIQLPAVKAKIVDVKALGLIMDVEVPSGFEKMTGKMKWNAVYGELIEEFGSPFNTKQIQVRGNLEVYDTTGRTSETAVVAYLTIRFKDVLPAITLKMNDNPEQESEYSCSYYRLEIGGVKYLEIDAFANTFFVKDKDQLKEYKKNLGF
ncbi:phage major tail tube protein [Parasegetibacter sp. NRK P23]|uniref:phage major tail tube protein n=1 Tax=Parasegetibacter sp. NRK P23 TaxID=2942999 RepID=UPI002043B896|nr:phage major tail tube protein [Parasegetibacter sp. NRK P23]MCM5528966.1 phage major tail tube protein [Parasegetibacter sp. NRK P23]